MSSKRIKILIILFTSFLLSLALLIAALTYWFQRPQNNPETVALIEKGTPLSQIASHLSDQNVLDFPLLFKAILYGTDQWRTLKAGEYHIPANVSPAQLVQILKSGKVILHPITLIEGETSHQLTQKLLQDLRFQGDCPAPSEGSLLPETYHFPRGTNRQVIVDHMKKAMQQTVAHAWAGRPKDCPLKTPEEMVTLASIVEKETALPRERPIVAAVFLNRLKIGMPLQADPTVLYALTAGMMTHRSLSLEDLKVDHPHNTYRHMGLPPSPIANPGLQSLHAVLNPANVSYLYFVADGSGGHVFATTLEEHQRNHEAWRRIRDRN